MKKRFETYIADNQLFTKEDKLLVAVSGGVDSMWLVHLMKLCGYNFSIAHCNYKLRGEESDGDEHFVRSYAAQIGVQYHIKRFDTTEYAQKKKISIQEAARDLRYEWFEYLRQKFDYQWIITAHHASDSVETMLFNFSRGSGLRGLKGIQPKNGFIVRPLLFTTKQEIVEAAQKENIVFREDSSNTSYKYTRNFIRQQIVPLYQHINPEFEKTAIDNLKYLSEANALLHYFIQQIKKEVVQTIDNQLFVHRINKNKLSAYPSVSTLLFEILKDYNFNSNQAEQILYEKEGSTKVGTKFYSATHILLIERDYYVVKPLHNKSSESLATKSGIFQDGVVILGIDSEVKEIEFNHSKLLLNQYCINDFEIVKDKNIAQLDADTLHFPLKLRHWHQGDFFKPFGMKGRRQKLSDFFNQNKISAFDKEKIWILETAKGEICWIVGYRIDERFRMTEGSVRCLKIELIRDYNLQQV